MSPAATPHEIRSAYRRLARLHHPDARGGTPSAEMAAINEAWYVLSDPARRVQYDAALRGGTVPPRPAAAGARTGPAPSYTAPRHDPFRRYADPPRFPWRFVLVVIALGVVAILGLGAIIDPADPAPVDNLLQAGSCVQLDEVRGEATEVPCDGPYDGTVEQLVPFGAICPTGTESFRDRQGMGQACVTRA